MTAAWQVPSSPWWWTSWTANPPSNHPATDAHHAFQQQLTYAQQHRPSKEKPARELRRCRSGAYRLMADPIALTLRLCKSLGVDIESSAVRSVSLNLSADDWPELVVRYLPDLDALGRLADEMEG